MEISLAPDAISVATSHGVCFAKFNLRGPHSSASYPLSSISDAGSDPFHAAGALTITAARPIDAISPPVVRSKSPRSIPRTLARRSRRTRRRSAEGGSEDDGDGDGFFGGGDGPFGGGGCGGRWNSDRGGESSWGESSQYSDPVFDFVYEVLCWIVLSHCMHFAFKRLVRIFGDLPREKLPLRFMASVC